jgi:DNA-binding MarR family transcriptional regulator
MGSGAAAGQQPGSSYVVVGSSNMAVLASRLVIGSDAPTGRKGSRPATSRAAQQHRAHATSSAAFDVAQPPCEHGRDAARHALRLELNLVAEDRAARRIARAHAQDQVAGRIVRLASLFGQQYASAFAALGLNDGDYGVLAALRRAGAPHELTPTELARQRMMTSGGMTAAIDRLQRQGLVDRTPNPTDRRGTLIGLTALGRELVDRAMEVHAQT